MARKRSAVPPSNEPPSEEQDTKAGGESGAGETEASKPKASKKPSVEDRLAKLEELAAETRADQILIANELGRIWGEPLKSKLMHVIAVHGAPSAPKAKK